MNIIYYLFSQFIEEEYINTIILIVCSFCISILQSGGISYTTANILRAVQKMMILKYGRFSNISRLLRLFILL